MNKISSYFSSTIVARGREYFRRGLVGTVYCLKHGRYQANVHGSEIYTTWLQLDGNLIQSGDCTCFYDEPCKHMAALWYAIEEQKVESSEPFSEWLAKQDADSLRIILRQLVNNPAISNQVLALCYRVDDKDYKGQVDKLFADLRDYKYYDFPDWVRQTQNWLDDVAEEGYQALAQALTVFIPRVIEALEYVEDYEGEIDATLAFALEWLEKTVDHAPSERLIDFLDELLHLADIDSFDNTDHLCHLYRIRMRIWQQRGEWQAWQHYLESHLARFSDDHWKLPFWAKEYWECLEAQNKKDEAQVFFTAHLYLPEFRKIAVENAMAQNNWSEAKRLLMDGIAIAQKEERLGQVIDWQTMLFTVLRESGDDIRELAATLAFSGVFSLKYYLEWKKTFALQDWQEEFPRLLSRIKTDKYTTYAQVLAYEKCFERLLPVLQESGNLSFLDRYASLFPEAYHPKIVEYYLIVLQRDIEMPANREKYRQFAKKLSTLRHEFPTQKEAVISFAKQIRTRYGQKPRRPALLDELSKAGF